MNQYSFKFHQFITLEMDLFMKLERNLNKLDNY